MADLTGDVDEDVLRFDFDGRLLLQSRGSGITPDAGLLPYGELDYVPALTDTGAEVLAMREPARMDVFDWPACCASRCSDDWPATRT